MKKVQIAFTVMLLLTLQSNAQQWETKKIVDEFGDDTGEKVDVVLIDGTFSNSYAYKKKLTAKIVNYGDFFTIDLYKYGTSPASKLPKGFGKIAVKVEDKASYYRVYVSDSGYIVINKNSKLFELINNSKGQKLKFSIDESKWSSYGRDKYNFVFDVPPS